MPEAWTADVHPLDVREIVRALDEHGVRHVLVGGVAAIVHGYSRSTSDADVVPERSDENLLRLGVALRALEAQVYANPARPDLLPDGAPPEAAALDFTDPRSFLRELSWQFSTRAGQLDVLLVIDGPGGYEPLSARAVARLIAGVRVLVVSLADLVEAKETAGRPKDLAALDELRQLLAQKSDRPNLR